MLSGIVDYLRTLAECWGFVWKMFGLNTVARCSANTLDFSTSSVILELSERQSGFDVFKDFFGCFPKRANYVFFKKYNCKTHN